MDVSDETILFCRYSMPKNKLKELRFNRFILQIHYYG